MANMTYKPPAVLPKTEYARVKELKRMLVESKGEQVVQKVIDIALDDIYHVQKNANDKYCADTAKHLEALSAILGEKMLALEN